MTGLFKGFSLQGKGYVIIVNGLSSQIGKSFSVKRAHVSYMQCLCYAVNFLEFELGFCGCPDLSTLTVVRNPTLVGEIAV